MRGLASRRPRRLRDLPEDDGLTPVFLDGKPALVPCSEVEPYYQQQMAPYDGMNVYERYGVSIWGMRWGMAPPFQRSGIEMSAPRVRTDPDFNSFVDAGKEIAMARLTTKERKALPKKDFAVPSRGEGKAKRGGYPIPDKSHARAALQRSSQFGSPKVKEEVRSAVKKRFPGIQQKKGER